MIKSYFHQLFLLFLIFYPISTKNNNCLNFEIKKYENYLTYIGIHFSGIAYDTRYLYPKYLIPYPNTRSFQVSYPITGKNRVFGYDIRYDTRKYRVLMYGYRVSYGYHTRYPVHIKKIGTNVGFWCILQFLLFFMK